MQNLLVEWKRLLGLKGWDIKLRDNCGVREFSDVDCFGECEYDLVHKTAVIRLLKESESGERMVDYDKEKTLVHELLHCKFAIIDNSGNDIVDRIIHQFVEDFAKALVGAKREGFKK